MATLDSDEAVQADARSQLAASRRDSEMTVRLQKARSLTIELLREITDDFSNERKIGQGAYGKVYVAKLENGEDIAVKILHNKIPGDDDAQFLREFENLVRLDHENIVKLFAYCYETQHEPMQYFGRTIFIDKTYRALCFEYMENGSLQKHLSDECTGLDWNTRYKIIKGVWEGLKYLHQGLEEPIYHLDIKPDNILLDNNMLPKLADFGMSKMFNGTQTMITQSPLGTFGYLPIEFLHGKIVSNKLDIFSLGVVMIKIIGGPEAHSRSVEMGHQEFLDLVHANWKERMQNTCAFGTLKAYCEQVNICTEIALNCMEIDRHKRPNIQDIIHQLNQTEIVIDEALSWSASLLRTSGNLVSLRAFTGSQGIVDAEARSMFPVMVQVSVPQWRPAEEMARARVDLVVVVDYDWEAMGIVINKLSSNDRLSFVGMGTYPFCLMELTFMTDKGKADANSLIINAKDRFPKGGSIGTLLGEAVEILRGRDAEEGDIRVGYILLQSGSGNCHTWGIKSEFPVYTIGLHRHIPYRMQHIANSTSGTYSFSEYSLKDTKTALELFMAGIVKVAATSIKITISAHEGVAISSIESGSYGNNVSLDKVSGEIDIHDIYMGEQKNFIVYLTVAEGKKKLVTLGGQYRSLNETSKLLPQKDVFLLRPGSGCSPGKLAMHHGVAAELARIRLVKGLLALVQRGGHLTILDMENLRGTVRLSKDGQHAPEETLSCLGMYVDEMKKFALPHHYVNPKDVPYLMSWLSCHQWQRATTKGLHYDSGDFTLAQRGEADEDDEDEQKRSSP